MISILMTTYNCAPYISQAIRSILNQTFKDFEFIIIDDGSNDLTEEIVNCFSDDRIKYIKRDHLGRSASLNYGLKKAEHEMIALMDADDIAHPLRLEKQIRLSSGCRNEISFTDAAYFKNYKVKYVVQNELVSSKLNKIIALHGHFINSTFFFNKSHILNCGGYYESLQVYEDYDLWLRIKDKSKFIFVNEILQFIRIRKDSLTSTNSIKINNTYYEIQRPYFMDLKKSFGIDDKNIQTAIRGWREYFYGNKKLCREYWRKIKFNRWNYRMFIAYFISFLSLNIVSYINKHRMRLRLEYVLNKRSNFSELDNEFQMLLKEILTN